MATDMTVWGPTNNKKRMVRFWWAAGAMQGVIFADCAGVVAGFLGEYDETENRPLTEEALRVLSWINGKDSSWMAGQVLTTAVGAVRESSIRYNAVTAPRPRSENSASTEGLSDATDSPKSTPTKSPQVKSFVFQLQPRMPLSSLDRHPVSRQPGARFTVL
eukprot:TRINITY_DN598_c0_g9_i1.p1 TRINITY_DN598_c0_g9~~TRINITY_DN598_c0_g9_i1.p1  ORF type:complete len:161 (+),score=25.71 TRINITY_DN598_c0_g9_i1:70-552(+)